MYTQKKEKIESQDMGKLQVPFGRLCLVRSSIRSVKLTMQG
jgi:hypothetical protein